MVIQEMEEKIGVTILLFSEFWHKPQNKQKIAFFGFKRKIVTRHKNFCKKCGMIFDPLATNPELLKQIRDGQKIAFSDRMVRKLRFRTPWRANFEQNFEILFFHNFFYTIQWCYHIFKAFWENDLPKVIFPFKWRKLI